MKHNSTFVAQCQGKEPMPRDKANRLARQQRGKGAKVEAYQCAHCGRWHVGGVDHTQTLR